MASVANITLPCDPIAINVAEATKALGFKDTKSVYELIRRGKLKARKSGRIILVSYASIKAYVEG